MNHMTRASSDVFLERFGRFHDAILRVVELRFGDVRTAQLVIAAQDATRSRADPWVVVRLALGGVQAFRLDEAQDFRSEVLSHGISVSWFGECIGLELGDLLSAPESLEGLAKSRLHFLCSSVSWSVEPYF